MVRSRQLPSIASAPAPAWGYALGIWRAKIVPARLSIDRDATRPRSIRSTMMALSPVLQWLRRAAPALLVMGAWCVAVLPALAEEDAHVVILNGIDPYLPPYMVTDTAMRAELDKDTPRRVILYSEPLDYRFPVESWEAELVVLLTKKYSGRHIDVVVAVTKPALDFFARHGEQLWPGARVIFHGISDPAVTADPGVVGVMVRDDLGGTIDIARRLQPTARRILFIGGASVWDSNVERHARRLASTIAGTAEIEFLFGLPLPELVARVAAEPADTIIIFLSQFSDRDGRPYTPRDVAQAISNASAAPVYSMYETNVGTGIAAGSMERYEDRGRLVGQLVREALAGTRYAPGKNVFTVASRCVADARALQRWSLDAERLPAGCDVRFAERPVWRQYWWQITLALAIIAAQALLITALIAQRRRRRIAEAESQKRFAEMAHMNRRVSMGELSASIAHELNQPLGAIHNNAGAAEMLIKADPPKLQEVAEILADIKRDDRRASEVIARIRKMLRKTQFEVQEIDLNETIGEAMQLVAEDAKVKGVSLKTELELGLSKVRADRVEVQQVILNLMLNAIEILHDQHALKRELVIRSRRANGQAAEVSVADSGPGIPGDVLPHIFEPFVTTKSSGMGLGLAISRTIVEAHGGQIRAGSSPTGGALFTFTLPFAETQRA